MEQLTDLKSHRLLSALRTKITAAFVAAKTPAEAAAAADDVLISEDFDALARRDKVRLIDYAAGCEAGWKAAKGV